MAERMLVVDGAVTDPAHGKAPAERTLDELLASSIVIVDKPAGPTSHQVAAWVRQMLGAPRAGHAGTLDPNATGLLLIAVGDATKALAVVEGADKRYIGHIALQREVPAGALRKVAEEFVGPVLQMPPKKSAVKRVRRVRRIYALRVLEDSARDALVDVSCEAGTYIRTLAHDMGTVLGVGAHLRDLRRVGVGPFSIGEAATLTQLRDAFENARELADAADLRRRLRPVEDLLEGHRKVVLKDSAVDAICHGAALMAPGVAAVDPGIEAGDEVALMSLKGEAVAMARARLTGERIAAASHGVLATPTRVLMAPSTYPRMWKAAKKGARARTGPA